MLYQVIGSALNSITSLFNNGCDVNTVKFHRGRQTVMLARSGSPHHPITQSPHHPITPMTSSIHHFITIVLYDFSSVLPGH